MHRDICSPELSRALVRSDADRLVRQIQAYAKHDLSEGGDWPEEHADDFAEVLGADARDPDKALAYVAIATRESDDPGFIAFIAASILENLLKTTDSKILARVRAEAESNELFRWMLSTPYRVAISSEAWSAIEEFRIAGEHEEPPPETMPGRK